MPDGNASDTSETESEAKDKKIAALEKELATMEDEFERELTQLSHKLTNESETAIFWQQKHSSLNQTFLKTDTELRLLRQELSGIEQMKESRDRDIKTRVSSLMLDRDAFREAYNEAMGELRVKEDMVKSLQGQVRGLKSFVSTSSKMDEQVTDEAFGERMQRLGNGLQNWVITNFRRVKIGMLVSIIFTLYSFSGFQANTAKLRFHWKHFVAFVARYPGYSDDRKDFFPACCASAKSLYKNEMCLFWVLNISRCRQGKRRNSRRAPSSRTNISISSLIIKSSPHPITCIKTSSRAYI
jgi:hypothetical protein